MDALSCALFTVRMMRSLFPGCCRKSGLSAAELLETEPNAAISISEKADRRSENGSEAMPQLNKCGKYVFGWSLIRADGSIHLPPMVVCEYNLAADDRIIIFTGSRITGGFCVTTAECFQARS